MIVTAFGNPTTTFSQTIAAGPFAGQKNGFPFNLSFNLTNGTGLDQCDVVGYWSKTFVASTLQTLNLLTDLVDAYGVAITTMARARGFGVAVLDQTGNGILTLAPSGANGWNKLFTGNLIIPSATAVNPHGSFAQFICPSVTGWTVDGTHKSIDMTPNAFAFSAVGFVIGASV